MNNFEYNTLAKLCKLTQFHDDISSIIKIILELVYRDKILTVLGDC